MDLNQIQQRFKQNKEIIEMQKMDIKTRQQIIDQLENVNKKLSQQEKDQILKNQVNQLFQNDPKISKEASATFERIGPFDITKMNIQSQTSFNISASFYKFGETMIEYQCQYQGMIDLLSDSPSGFGRYICKDSFVFYFADGQFLNGKHNSILREIDKSGVLTIKNYINNKQNGTEIGYFPNGQKYIEEEYLDGVQTGNKTFYNEDGSLLQKREFDWEKNGIQIDYNKDGSINNISKYKNGMNIDFSPGLLIHQKQISN